MELENNIRLALKQVFDRNTRKHSRPWFDLRNCKGENRGGYPVTVTMTLTAPNCPMAEEVVEDAV
jgi:metal-sulfur cluster biosynthetic enzyme